MLRHLKDVMENPYCKKLRAYIKYSKSNNNALNFRKKQGVRSLAFNNDSTRDISKDRFTETTNLFWMECCINIYNFFDMFRLCR